MKAAAVTNYMDDIWATATKRLSEKYDIEVIEKYKGDNIASFANAEDPGCAVMLIFVEFMSHSQKKEARKIADNWGVTCIELERSTSNWDKALNKFIERHKAEKEKLSMVTEVRREAVNAPPHSRSTSLSLVRRAAPPPDVEQVLPQEEKATTWVMRESDKKDIDASYEEGFAAAEELHTEQLEGMTKTIASLREEIEILKVKHSEDLERKDFEIEQAQEQTAEETALRQAVDEQLKQLAIIGEQNERKLHELRAVQQANSSMLARIKDLEKDVHDLGVENEDLRTKRPPVANFAPDVEALIKFVKDGVLTEEVASAGILKLLFNKKK